MTRKRWVLAGAVIVSATAAASAWGISATGSSSGGVAAGVSALQGAAVPTSLSPEAQTWLESAARHTKTPLEEAASGVRLLRSDLGVGARDAYAFRASTGAICFYLTEEVGACPNRPDMGDAGLQWTIGGGDGATPANLFALAADDVTAVDLTVDGKPVPVSLANNVAFAEFRADGVQAEIAVTHVDGSTNTVSIHLDDGPPAPIGGQ